AAAKRGVVRMMVTSRRNPYRARFLTCSPSLLLIFLLGDSSSPIGRLSNSSEWYQMQRNCVAVAADRYLLATSHPKKIRSRRQKPPARKKVQGDVGRSVCPWAAGYSPMGC